MKKILKKMLIRILILGLFCLTTTFGAQMIIQTSFGEQCDQDLFNPTTTDNTEETNILLSRTEYKINVGSPPMKYDYVTAVPLPEITVWGQDSGSADLNGIIYDDILNDGGVATFDYDDDSANPDIAWGDFGGDNLLELFVVSTDGDDNDLNAWYFDDYYSQPIPYRRVDVFNENDNYYAPTVLCGDFDQKAWDDVFIAAYAEGNITMKIIRWNSNILAFEEVWSDSYFVGYASPIYNDEVDSAKGDFDGDGVDEIVVLYSRDENSHFRAWIIDYQMDEYLVTKSWDLDLDSYRFKTATGDVDGDFRDEIIFLGTDGDGDDLNGWLYDDAINDYQEIHRWDADDNSKNPEVDMGDIDADGRDEIVFFSTDKDGHDMNLWVWDDALLNFTELARLDNDDDLGKGDVACGDLDLDGVDEIVVASEYEDAVVYHKIHTLVLDFDGTNLNEVKRFITDRRTANPVIALADVHLDGITLKYVGEGTPAESTTDPEIMVIMALPPSIDNISQGSCSSTFGESDTTSQTESKSVSINSAVTLTWQNTIVPDFAQTKLSLTLSRGLTSSVSQTKTVSRATYYSISDTDGVVFAKTDLAHYNYEIWRHPTNSSKVGEIVTINVPTASNIYKWDLDYFDEQYPSYNLRNRVFSHVIGDASSYPSFDDFSTIVSEPFWYTDSQAVGQGTGSITTMITVSDSLTEGQSRTLSTSVTSGISIGGYGVSTSVTYSSTTSYSLTIGESMIYKGTVGDIDDAYYNDYKYNFGLMVYAFEDNDLNMVYQVINYWTEGAKTPPSEPPSTTSGNLTSSTVSSTFSNISSSTTEPVKPETTVGLGFPPELLLLSMAAIIVVIIIKRNKK